MSEFVGVLAPFVFVGEGVLFISVGFIAVHNLMAWVVEFLES